MKFRPLSLGCFTVVALLGVEVALTGLAADNLAGFGDLEPLLE